MKKKFYIVCCTLATLFATACMNDFDEVTFDDNDLPYGNNAIGEANTTIQALKEKYKSTYLSSNDSYTLINEDIRIKGKIITNDESGNVYKQLAIQDETGGIIIGVNATGTYAYLPMGQEVVIDCKGLYFGGYRKLPQLGALYNGAIGRMSESMFKEHIKLVGNAQMDIEPLVLTEEWLSDAANKDNQTPLYVKLNKVKFLDGNGSTLFSPIDGATQSRSVKVGQQEVALRISSYANFAMDTIPVYNVDITGTLTRYNNYWQLLLRVLDDIQPSK